MGLARYQKPCLRTCLRPFSASGASPAPSRVMNDCLPGLVLWTVTVRCFPQPYHAVHLLAAT